MSRSFIVAAVIVSSYGSPASGGHDCNRSARAAERAAVKSHAALYPPGVSGADPFVSESARLLFTDTPGNLETRLYRVGVADAIDTDRWYVLIRQDRAGKCWTLSVTNGRIPN